MSLKIRHRAISASAGAGKTYQLVHRYLGLVAAGTAPEKIIALTFSRKAAGEMFERILQTLAGAAADPEPARKLSRQLQDSGFLPPGSELKPQEVVKLLRRMVNVSHRLRIGTLDSFLVSIIQSFPFECGLGGSLTILDGYPAAAARQEALHQVFRKLPGDNHQAARHFLDNFRLTTFGQESKSFTTALQAYIDEYHPILLEAEEADLWGNPDRIWPAGSDWRAALDRPDQAITVLGDFLRHQQLPATVAEKCTDFLTALTAFHPIADWDKVSYLYLKLRDLQTSDPAGAAELKLNRTTINLSAEARTAAERIFAYITATAIDARLRRTRGLFQILNEYEKIYRRNIRQVGRLTFTDIAFLLGGRHLNTRPEASAAGGAGLNRIDHLDLDYRLDSHYDHWLLDEFQDTSTLQWQAIANLVDEVVQDQTGRRSFFYVGDVKQAIYGWRGGDPALFDWILNRYGSEIERQPLARSYRSSQPVIDLVNVVFDNLAATSHELELDPGIARRWQENWQRHTTVHTRKPGFAGVYALPYIKNQSSQENEQQRFTAALQVLHQIRPWERGLSTAALVRTNDHGRRLTGFLREAGVPAHFAGKFGILDTPVNAALIELIKIAEHPGDTYAWQHLLMTPLRQRLPHSAAPPSTLITDLLQDLAENGYESLLRHWSQNIASSLTAFEGHRLQQLIIAGRQFDALGGGRATAFLEYLEACEVEESAAVNTVQVMTNHKAKGLQFDLVILACLDRNQGIETVGGQGILHVARSETAERRPQWVFDMPGRDIAMADPVLAAALEQKSFDHACEELCNLYVAMTRAEHGLYIFRTTPGPSSRTVRPSSLIAAALTRQDEPERTVEIGAVTVQRLYGRGDPRWYEQITRDQPARPPATTACRFGENMKTAPQRRRYRRETPTEEEVNRDEQAGWIFNLENQTFAQFGTALHAFLSRIEWYDENLPLERICNQAITELGIDPDIGRRAMAQLQQALTRPLIQQALSRPSRPEPVEVWLEQRFELILRQAWISGCFDRVVIYRNRRGRPEAAVITDFKTSVINQPDDLERARQSYTPQLTTYREALAQIIGLDQQHIKTQLIFTRSGDVLTCH